MRLDLTPLRAIELFAGIGGIRAGFQEVFKDGLKFIFASEPNKKAQFTYKENYKTRPKGGIVDVCESAIPSHDILLVGAKKGSRNKEDTPLCDVIRVVAYHLPSVLFIESNKDIIKGKSLATALDMLGGLGYKTYSRVINSKDFSVPQDRERIYIIGFIDHNIDFSFPVPLLPIIQISDLLEKDVNDKYYYHNKLMVYGQLEDEVIKHNTVYTFSNWNVIETPTGLCPTLTPNIGTWGDKVPLVRDTGGVRRFTPREYLRLQGFREDYILPNIADSHKYSQIASSATVRVVAEIASEIKIALDRRVKELKSLGGASIPREHIYVDELGFFDN